MTGVHGLEHVQGLAAADFSYDDPVGPHSEGVDDQLANADPTLAFYVVRARFQVDHVDLTQLELGSVLNGDDALVRRDEAGEHVERRGLSR